MRQQWSNSDVVDPKSPRNSDSVGGGGNGSTRKCRKFFGRPSFSKYVCASNFLNYNNRIKRYGRPTYRKRFSQAFLQTSNKRFGQFVFDRKPMRIKCVRTFVYRAIVCIWIVIPENVVSNRSARVAVPVDTACFRQYKTSAPHGARWLIDSWY